MLTATVVGADNGVEPCPLRTTDTVASNIEVDIVACSDGSGVSVVVVVVQ